MKRSLLAAAATVILAGVSAAQSPSLSGQWKLYSNIQGHENDFECTFSQTGKELKGSCKSGPRELTITGTVEENKVLFQYKTEYEGQELTIVHTGKLESPSKLTGSVDVQPMEVSGEFTAAR